MKPKKLPDLSRFELQCLWLLSQSGKASAGAVHAQLNHSPSYSTVRKIFERLENKGAIERVGKSGRSVVYRPLVSGPAMIRKEIARLLDSLFDGAAAPLLSHLAQMQALDLDDLREIERQLDSNDGSSNRDSES